jgi:hypothetical protein
MRNTQTKSFAEELLKDRPGAGAANDDVSDKERQIGAQAFTLRVKYSDNRRIEGFPWSHYTGYQWTDEEGAKERLTLMFGARAVVIEGYRLRNLLREIDDGRRRHLIELTDTEMNQAVNAPEENDAVIASVKSYPDFEEIFRDIKGENQRETRFTERLER